MRFDVRDYGAAGDGRTRDTGAIQRAVDACGAAGGGEVLLQGGTFLSGTLCLRSGVMLHVDVSARLVASVEDGDYLTGTHWNRYRNEKDMDRCFIFAEDAEHTGLCGRGEINGNGMLRPAVSGGIRPMLIRFLRCRHVCVEGLRLWDSPAWTTAFLDSEDIRVRDLDIRNSRQYNGDGLNFDGCRRVWVSGCRIDGTDDNLCLQSSNRAYPVEHVHISDCHFTSVCAGIRIGLKSIGEIRHVTITNCTMRNVLREGIKIECTEGGDISDICVSNLSMRNVRRPLFVLLNNRFIAEGLGSSLELETMPAIGTLERLIFSGITAVDDDSMMLVQKRFGRDVMGSPSFQGFRFDAADVRPIRDVILRDIVYSPAGGVRLEEIPSAYPVVPDRLVTPEGPASENYYPDWSRAACMDIRNVRGLRTENLIFRVQHPDERPELILEGCEE